MRRNKLYQTLSTSAKQDILGNSILFFQPKLSINQPNDVYEQEANSVADSVMQIKAPSTDPKFFSPDIQRRDAQYNSSVDTENYISSLSGGKTLNKEEKKFFESRMGYDFSNVRLHTDSAANQSAKKINALAYTYGNNIVFAAGQYQTASQKSKHLLSHELTHVVQQNQSVQRKNFQTGNHQKNISQLSKASLFVQKQSPQEPAQTVPQNDEIVQMIIDTALERNGSVGNAFSDLRKRRCLSENCGNENLAAAEHYMFARWWVQDSMVPPEVMTLIMAGFASLYQLAKLLPIVPSFCPNECPPTPPGFFQFGWAIKGIEDGLITASVPKSIV